MASVQSVNFMKMGVATLTALGVAGVASHASAALTTFPIAYDLTDPSSSTYTANIYLNTTNPVFQYSDVYDGAPGKFDSTFSTLGSSLIAASAQSGSSFDPTQTFIHGGYGTNIKGFRPPLGSDYLSLKFQDDTGHWFDGVADFGDGNGDLLGITFAPAPEPDTWGLLIAGAGLTGAVLRGNRRKVATTA
jgi:hypothetical protein